MDMARQSDPFPDPDPAVPVLLTRPRAQGEGFAGQLTRRFGPRVLPIIAPLMAPAYLSPPIPPGPFGAVVFTSAHGVEGALRLGLPLPPRAYCVGRSTAAAAQAAGLTALSANGTAGDLVKLVRSDPPNGRLLYIRGVDTSGDIAKDLNSLDIPTVSLQVYVQEPIPFEGESLALFAQGAPLILPLFSPRSAHLFRQAMPADSRADLRIVAISDAVAKAAAAIPHSAMVVARNPDAGGMLEGVETLLAATPLP
jgi:uroporphyrinogen-III synthase